MWNKRRAMKGDHFEEERFFDDMETPNPGAGLNVPSFESLNKNLQSQQKDEPKPEEPEEDEIDPLDAFMSGIQVDAKRDMMESINNTQKILHPNKKEDENKKEERDFDDDPLDHFMDGMKKKVLQQQGNLPKKQKQDSDIESCSDENLLEKAKGNEFLDDDGDVDFDALRKVKKKRMEELPELDHKTLEYTTFNKNFYNEHPEITNLSNEQVAQLNKNLEIKTIGSMVPKPIVAFGHLDIEEALVAKFAKLGYEKPTPIQAQALPCVLSGRDVIGIAKTGSGKTLAYILPQIIHIQDQPEIEFKEGPIGVVLCPTRELSQQVYLEAKKYAKIYNINVCALLGGENKHDQWKELRNGVEILVATPGRLIDMYRKKAQNFKRVTYVVLDEADKMFGMGFEWQIRQILGQSRPDRQTVLFSATFNKKVREVCMDYLEYPIQIIIGKENQANEDVKQEVMTFQFEEDKFEWLRQTVGNQTTSGKVQIFVNTIKACDELQKQLQEKSSLVIGIIHGDKLQYDRTNIQNSFRKEGQILIATDVASRGLDIPAIKWVINYENPKDIATHVHRIGRTGRAGATDGVAITLLLRSDTKFGAQLAKNLDQVGSVIPPDLEDIAMKDQIYKEYVFKKKLDMPRGKEASKQLKEAINKGQKGKTGLGFVDTENKKKNLKKAIIKVKLNHSLIQVQKSFRKVEYLLKV